ncbi:MAG: relaxase/mobilization nuclease domain-containing protein [Oscillospiraceae bacterium]|nr:relaxase/mobilization nuclease domain-containing protein [Oscillospiraceae bacterium]
MPFIKCISVRSTVKRSLSYILNSEKTDDLLYTASLNCLTDPECAYLNMKMVYKQFSGRKFNEPPPKQGKGHIKAIHYIQSFDPKDNITPETAFEIGKLFITKAFGKNAQVVLATHLDRGHLHNHIIINSYGIDGNKFYANKETLNKIKEISDRASLTYGVQPYDKSKAKRSTIAYNEWQNEQCGTSWKQKIRDEIDGLMTWVKNVDELLAELEILGYTVKRGKYISVKAPYQKRFVRLQTLGADYTAESLLSRILWRDVGLGTISPCTNSPLRNSYNFVIDREESNGADVYKLSVLLSIINRDNLRSIGEVEGKINQLKYELEKSRKAVNEMETKCNLLRSLAAQAEEYFALMDKPSLTAEKKLRAEMYRETLSLQNIESTSDYEYLKGVIIETDQKVAPIKAHYNKCAALLKEYSDIAITYEEISQGDYISKLIEQQRKKDEPQTRPRR